MTDGLRARREVPAEVLEAIRAAAETVILDERRERAHPATWRFSGRWFSAHPIRTRTRPG